MGISFHRVAVDQVVSRVPAVPIVRDEIFLEIVGLSRGAKGFHVPLCVQEAFLEVVHQERHQRNHS